MWSSSYWDVCLILCKSGWAKISQQSRDSSTVQKASVLRVCMFIPFLTGVLPLLSHSDKLTEPHRQWVGTASRAFSTKSFTKAAFLQRVWRLSGWWRPWSVDPNLPSFKNSKGPLSAGSLFTIVLFLQFYLIYFFCAGGWGALTNWGKLDCVTSPSALADRPTEN